MKNSKNTGAITIHWSYKPLNFFKEKQELDFDDCTVELSEGMVIARLKSKKVTDVGKVADEITKPVQYLFWCTQFKINKPYSLSDHMTVMVADNTMEPVELTVAVDPGLRESSKVTVYDQHCDFMDDSIEKSNCNIQRSLRWIQKDETARSLMESFHNSINEPQNTIIRLFDIRNTLQKKFHGKARETLKIPEKTWNDFEELARDVSIQQSRQRRSHVDNITRKATNEELIMARKFARKMITSYFDYLEKK